eukprot:CAMPEP_0174324668 /NCGR_PEP_ID=MMETSP0810-20121108/12655_1 /TAXON_ID=73025 ORGANISM="Eutreptiella gymnastica-like, Strain CCMP1594" /NCGR_SAMPLE_ID=MMETSP0810 /ASSEMBLY_ACC=CAM_ASM_000659 /LENGTH=108 /DNA_ID=CAMNT_0015437561 /DNA_START=1509 /DNA_END=1835 /DNA_ORIENTATION=+
MAGAETWASGKGGQIPQEAIKGGMGVWGRIQTNSAWTQARQNEGVRSRFRDTDPQQTAAASSRWGTSEGLRWGQGKRKELGTGVCSPSRGIYNRALGFQTGHGVLATL